MTEVRDATLGDAESILKIYDYYVKTTAITFEYDSPTLAEFEDRMKKTSEHTTLTNRRLKVTNTERPNKIQGESYEILLLRQ